MKNIKLNRHRFIFAFTTILVISIGALAIENIQEPQQDTKIVDDKKETTVQPPNVLPIDLDKERPPDVGASAQNTPTESEMTPAAEESIQRGLRYLASLQNDGAGLSDLIMQSDLRGNPDLNATSCPYHWLKPDLHPNDAARRCNKVGLSD